MMRAGALWTGLTAFLENGAVPLDNNGAERALRGVVVGRKNLSSGTARTPARPQPWAVPSAG